MKVAIGPGSGPDTGPWWATEDKIYWSNGDITPNANDGMAWRTGFGPFTYIENYSIWSDEQRAQAKAKAQAEIARYRAIDAVRNAQNLATLTSIKAKLTEEEWDYVQGCHEYTPECGWPT